MQEDLKEKVLELAENGVITSEKVTASGFHRSVLSELTKDGLIIKCSRGIYMLADEWEDEFFLLQKKYARGIFSYTSSLYLLGYSERVPIQFHMTFPTNYHTPSLQNENISVTRVIPENYELGLTTAKTPYGNIVSIYDLERSLCDVLRGKGDDLQVVQYAMKKYASSRDKDVNKLMRYAKKLRVETKVRNYMEVLL